MRRRLGAAVAGALLVAACSGGGSGAASSGSSSGGTTTAQPATTASTTTTTAAVGVAGAEGVGDTYFPDLGNGGYDVEHYDLDLKVAADGSIEARATITATATQDLASFDLDLSGLEVRAVTVSVAAPAAHPAPGAAAATSRHDRELVVTPATPLRSGDRFEAVVDYGGRPEPVDTVVVGGIEVGWQRNGGGSFVMSEPEGARTWFPANDHPSDKATFTIHVTTPPGLDAVANGVATGTEQTADGTRATFDVAAPMATYLATVVVGQLDVRTTAGPAGVAIRDVYPAGEGDDQAQYFGDQAAMLAFFAERFGPYPFPVYGALVTDGLRGLDFEAQTMSLFGPGPAPEIVAHELAHQWFGDSVTPARWSDIWLNEGFATFGEWLWLEHIGVRTTAQSAARAVSSGPGPIRDPGVRAMFDDAVYSRGGATLEALRETIGDAAFYDVLRTYAARFAGKTVTTDDFVAVAQEVSGRDLGDLFAAWLDAPSPPALPG